MTCGDDYEILSVIVRYKNKCVCVRERETEKEREKERNTGISNNYLYFIRV